MYVYDKTLKTRSTKSFINDFTFHHNQIAHLIPPNSMWYGKP